MHNPKPPREDATILRKAAALLALAAAKRSSLENGTRDLLLNAATECLELADLTDW